MDQRITIQLDEFPEDGLYLESEVDGALFDIDDTGACSTTPMAYKLHAQLIEDELLLQGSADATFRLRCDRCLREFDYTVYLDDITLVYEVKGKDVIDITDDLREEIILNLPPYPKCEISDLECELNDIISDFRLDKDTRLGVDSATPSGKSVWDALDKLS